VSEVCGLGLCAVYVGYFPFPRFYGYIELTPCIYICIYYIFNILLVPGWHLECPHHLFFQNLPVQKVRYSKQKVCQNYLYICLFIETHCSQEFLRILYIYIYIYLSIYIYMCVCASMFGCRYHTHKTCRV